MPSSPQVKVLKPLRLFVLISVLLIVSAFGLSLFFLARFEPNNYREWIETKLADTSGFRIKLGSLSLAWREGLGITVDGLAVQDSRGQTTLLQADTVQIKLSLFSLLKFKPVLYEFTIVRPRLSLIKSPEGYENWGLIPSGHSPKASTESGIALLFSRAIIEDGSLSYRDLSRRDLPELALQGIDAHIEQGAPGRADFEIQYQENVVRLQGFVNFLGRDPAFEGKLKITRLNTWQFEELLRRIGEGRGYLAGMVSGSMEFGGKLSGSKESIREIRSRGSLEILEGAFLDINIVGSVLNQITILPGLREILLGTVPAKFQAVLQHRDTPFEKLATEFSMENGLVSIQSFEIKDFRYAILADGSFDVDGRTDLRGQLGLSKEMTDYFTGRMEELSYLTNRQGELVIPFVFRGLWPSIQFRPDLGYIAQNVVVTQGSQLVEKGIDVLSKILGEKQ